MQQRVSLIKLGARDIAALAAFNEALGRAQVDSPDGMIAFDLIGQTPGHYPLATLAQEIGVPLEDLGRGAVTLAHNVHDKAQVAPRLACARAAGARVLKPTSDGCWGGHHGYFSDADGHIWEIAWSPPAPLGLDGALQWKGVG